MFYQDPFDVIIIGGGHAGTEAAMAAARMGPTNPAFDTQYRYAGADEAATRRLAALGRDTW